MEGNPRNYPHGAGGGVRQARARRRGMMMVWNMPTQAMIAPMIFAFSPDTKLNFWSMIRKPNIRINTPLRRKRLRAKKRCFAAASRDLCSSVTGETSLMPAYMAIEFARVHRTATYNQLIRIEEGMGSTGRYAGRGVL